MSVRFVIGRAGAGKTDHCLSAIRGRLIESPLDGPRLLFIVPEQAALQAERSLIDDPKLGGAHRAEVMGFRRLAQRITAGAVAAGPTALSPNGRAMTLRYVLGRLGDRLQYYRRVDRLGGFVNRLAHTIGEFFDEAVEPDDLSAAVARCGDDPLRSRKLVDLHLIYAAYLEHLGDSRLDPSQHLAVARRHVRTTPWLRGAEIWVDGFAGFTRQEALLLAELAGVAACIEVTAMADPRAVATALRSTRPLPRDAADLFAKTVRTCLNLRDEFLRAGAELLVPLLLQPARSPRFAGSPQLARLEADFLTGTVITAAAGPVEPVAVELVALPDRRVEVDYAVSRVCEWVQRSDRPLRYRDIALIVRDLEPYHDLLGVALSDRNIPFFIDRRRPTAHHPLVELLRGLAVAAAESLSVESVRVLLKTGLLGIDEESADELENFILAHGIAGYDVWTGGDWEPTPEEARVGFRDKPLPDPSPAERRQAERVNVTRRALLDRLSAWLEFARSARSAIGREWARQLAQAMQRLNVAGRLESWAAAAEDDGDLDAAEEHRQVWRDTVGFIDDLADALGDQELTIAELASVLEAGLSQFTLGLAPPMLDQVLVGAIERSRHPEIKAVVILGSNDTAFPHTGSEDSILNDDDRDFLAAGGLRVGTPQRQRILEERLLTYVAVTRASEAVVLTYPLADEQGRELRVSPFADDLRAACPHLAERAVVDPLVTRQTWPLLSSSDLAAALAMEFRHRPTDPGPDGDVRRGWNDIYEAARADEQLRGCVGHALSSLTYTNRARLSPDLVRRMVTGPLNVSVSQLERFAACPFQHFADYSLKLRERRLAEVQAVDLGKVHHAILEDFIDRLVEGNEPLGRLDEQAALGRLAESADRVTLRPPMQGAYSLAREAYLLRRGREDLARVVQAQRRVEALGRFRSRGTEVPFGMPDEPARKPGLPALEIDTPAGRRVRLRGYIDRVDLAELGDELLGAVVDYKRTPDKRLELAKVYHGLSLQLLGYLLVLAEHGTTLGGRPIRPVGAFYVSLVPKYTLLEHPNEYDEEQDSPARTHGPRGLLDFGRLEALDAGCAKGRSLGYSVAVRLDGGISNLDRSDAAHPEAFAALLERARYQLGCLADGVLDGDVSVAPYRLRGFSPCAWCRYRSVCRFEFGQGQVRLLDDLTRTQVFDRLGGAGERGD